MRRPGFLILAVLSLLAPFGARCETFDMRAHGVELDQIDDQDLKNAVKGILVKIERYDPQERKWLESCTGIFVGPQEIVTAGHCYKEFEDQQERRYLFAGVEVSIDGLPVVHPGYRKEELRRRVRKDVYEVNIYNDLALIRTKNAYPVKSPAIFRNGAELDAFAKNKRDWMVVGYGMSSCYGAFGDPPDGKARLAHEDDLVASNEDRLEFTQDREGTCAGDSGGPLFVWEDGRLQLLGVVSQFVPQHHPPSHARFQKLTIEKLNELRGAPPQFGR